jgi:hypothetical protein
MNESGLSREWAMSKLMMPSVARAPGMISGEHGEQFVALLGFGMHLESKNDRAAIAIGTRCSRSAVYAVTALDAIDGGLVPLAFVAVTVQV